MRAQVKKWGNSAAIRLPASVLQAAHLTVESAVDITVRDGRVVIDAVQPQELDLADMVAAITPQNRHQETDWGPAVGQEIL